mgnify:FL=1
MFNYFRISLLGVLIAFALPAIAVHEGIPHDDIDPVVEAVDEFALSEGGEKVVAKIAATFAEAVGTEEDAADLVTGLVNGIVTYTPPQIDTNNDGVIDELDDPVEPLVVDGRQMGFGNAFKTLAIASHFNGDVNFEGDFDDAMNEVLRLRLVEEMGWGEIAQELGFKLGHVNSSFHSGKTNINSSSEDASESPVGGAETASASSNRSANPEKASKAQNSSKVEKVSKVAKVNKPEKIERVAKFDRPERPERPDKPEKPERVEKFEKPSKPERAGK